MLGLGIIVAVGVEREVWRDDDVGFEEIDEVVGDGGGFSNTAAVWRTGVAGLVSAGGGVLAVESTDSFEL